MVRKWKTLPVKVRDNLQCRQWRQWWKTKMPAEVPLIFNDVARRVHRSGHPPEKHPTLIRNVLVWMLEEESRPGRRGRPAKGGGLIHLHDVIAKGVAVPGRPRLIDPKSEQLWVSRLYGVALRMWLEDGFLDSSQYTATEAAALVKRRGGLTAVLEFFPKAVRSSHMAPFNPPAKNTRALVERARRASMRFNPPGALEM